MSYTLKLEMWDDGDYESLDLTHFTHMPTRSDLIEAENDYSFEWYVYQELLSSENKSLLVYDGAFQKDYLTLVEITDKEER